MKTPESGGIPMHADSPGIFPATRRAVAGRIWTAAPFWSRRTDTALAGFWTGPAPGGLTLRGGVAVLDRVSSPAGRWRRRGGHPRLSSARPAGGFDRGRLLRRGDDRTRRVLGLPAAGHLRGVRRDLETPPPPIALSRSQDPGCRSRTACWDPWTPN